MTASAMLSVEAALEFVLNRARPLTETESVHLLNAGQRILANDLRARLDERRARHRYRHPRVQDGPCGRVARVDGRRELVAVRRLVGAAAT